MKLLKICWKLWLDGAMWEIAQNSRVLFGCKKTREIAGLFDWHRLKRIFIVTYSVDAPVLNLIKKDLESKNIGYSIYNKIRNEPDLSVIDEGTAMLIELKA